MRIPALLLLTAALTGGAYSCSAEAQRGQSDLNAFPPHKVIGNVYYVGTEELASFLITTPEGHILINSGYETTVPVIRAAVEKLGFRFADIRILLGSHAHRDHMEGDALVKEQTGAQVMAMQQDVTLLSEIRPGNKRHPIDRVLKDRDEVKLGGTILVAYLTAGHTNGCTTWTLKVQEDGRSYDVVIIGSINLPARVALVNNRDYPQIAADYRRTLSVLRSLPIDVFLAPHADFYDMAEKYSRLGNGAVNPFIDTQGLKKRLDEQEKSFLSRLDTERKGAPQ
jgi:metallo-beta-lactamase class B